MGVQTMKIRFLRLLRVNKVENSVNYLELGRNLCSRWRRMPKLMLFEHLGGVEIMGESCKFDNEKLKFRTLIRLASLEVKAPTHFTPEM